MAQMIGNLDVEAAAQNLFWNGYVFTDAEKLVSHIAAEYGLDEREVSEIDADKVLHAHQSAAA